MEIVLLIGLTGALGCLALGLGVFVLSKPPPARQGRPAIVSRFPDGIRTAHRGGKGGAQTIVGRCFTRRAV
jgi:hypothetical protein